MNRALGSLVASMTVFGVLQGAPLTPEQTLNRRSVGDLEFSPDGSRLVFTVTEPVKGTERTRSVWLLDVARDSARPLHQELADHVREERQDADASPTAPH
jgi:dipeptidyl aminopeptidase/acylaminoacyl peptidase